MNKRAFIEKIKNRISARVYMSMIIIVTICAGLVVDRIMFLQEINNLPLRYCAAVSIAFTVFCFMVYFWVHWFLTGESALDLGDSLNKVEMPNVSLQSGGSFDGIGDLGGGDGEAWVILLIIAFVVAIFGSAVYLIYEAPEILSDVVFEVLLAAGFSRSLAHLPREGWFKALVKKTWIPFLIILFFAFILGANLRANCPAAASIGEYFEICTDKKLDVSKNYERRYQPPLRGHKYPVDLYLEGDRTNAFSHALRSCELVNDVCAYYIREMPDHPQMNKLVELSEKSCRSFHKDGWGLNNCDLLGAYYYSVGIKTKAVEIWKDACRQHAFDSCRMLIGSHLLNRAEEVKSYLSFCAVWPRDLVTKNIHRKVCERNLSQDLPVALVSNSERILQEYLDRQRQK